MAKVVPVAEQTENAPVKKNWLRRAWEKLSGSDGQYRHIDRLYLLIVLVLLGFGLVMLYSASYAYSYYWHDGNSFYYILRQIIFAIIGFVGMLALIVFDYRHFMRLSWWIYLVTIFLLLIVITNIQ